MVDQEHVCYNKFIEGVESYEGFTKKLSEENNTKVKGSYFEMYSTKLLQMYPEMNFKFVNRLKDVSKEVIKYLNIPYIL